MVTGKVNPSSLIDGLFPLAGNYGNIFTIALTMRFDAMDSEHRVRMRAVFRHNCIPYYDSEKFLTLMTNGAVLIAKSLHEFFTLTAKALHEFFTLISTTHIHQLIIWLYREILNIVNPG